jgi:hypothetical protein
MYFSSFYHLYYATALSRSYNCDATTESLHLFSLSPIEDHDSLLLISLAPHSLALEGVDNSGLQNCRLHTLDVRRASSASTAAANCRAASSRQWMVVATAARLLSSCLHPDLTTSLARAVGTGAAANGEGPRRMVARRSPWRVWGGPPSW